MKNLYTLILFTATTLFAFGQAPIIYGTFLPVNGTQVREVWDTTNNTMKIPTKGIDTVWNYSLTNYQPSDTFTLKTSNPTSVTPTYVPNSSKGNAATNALFVRAVKKAITADSLILFYDLNYSGFYNNGAYDEKKYFAGFKKITNAPYEYSKPELVVPFIITYPVIPIKDTMIAQSTFNVSFLGTITHKIYRRKIMTSEGYGTLITPAGTFDKVILAKEVVTEFDTIFNSSNQAIFNIPSSFVRYTFLRNNRFASTVLMFIQDNNGDGKSDMAWYTLPIDFGSISGTAKDSSGTALTAGNNTVFLYREYSNFFKNDILATTKVDANGNYNFDSIPYGYYRVQVRPDTSIYKNSIPTYYGDTSSTSSASWMDGDSINTVGCQCDVNGKDVTIKYFGQQNNPVTISGNVSALFPYVGAPAIKKKTWGKNEFNTLGTSVDDIDIIVKKKPSGSIVKVTTVNGNFSINNLNQGTYDVFVDVPGLEMNGSPYTIAVGNTTTLNCLDFALDPNLLKSVNGPQAIRTTNTNCIPLSVTSDNSSVQLIVYPNPSTVSSTITLKISEKNNVVLELYNVMGLKIYTIENEVKQAGTYSYLINQNNLALSSGIYFIKVVSNNEQKVIKIIQE